MRNLKKEESELIIALLKDKANTNDIIKKLPDLLVEEMDDGGMGSLKFISTNGETHSFFKQVAEITLLDIDGIRVSIAINLDENGDIFELDIFKSDFSKLKQFPVPPYISIE